MTSDTWKTNKLKLHQSVGYACKFVLQAFFTNFVLHCLD